MRGSTLKSYVYKIDVCSPRGEKKRTYSIGGSSFYSACVNYINITKTPIVIAPERVMIYRAATEEESVLAILIEKGQVTFSKLEEFSVEKAFKILTGADIEGKPRRELKQEQSNNFKITVKISK